MNINGIARAQYQVSHLVEESSKKSADRAREAEGRQRLDAGEEQQAAVQKQAKAGLAGAIVSGVMTMLSLAGSFVTFGATGVAAATANAMKTIIEVTKIISQGVGALTKFLLGRGAGDNQVKAKEMDVQAERLKNIAERKEQRESVARRCAWWKSLPLASRPDGFMRAVGDGKMEGETVLGSRTGKTRTHLGR